MAPSAAYATEVTACRPVSDNTKIFYPPGRGAVKVEVNVCVVGDVEHGFHMARAHVGWYRPNGGPLNAFDKFVVHTRLERYDVFANGRDLDLRPAINFNASGSRDADAEWRFNTSTGGWTSDVTIEYDLDNDGKGRFVWDLHGSHEVSLDEVE